MSGSAQRVTAERLQRALAAHRRMDMPALPGRTNHLPSGVLVPLLCGERTTCLVTVRASGLREHAGEVCFPGGRPEPGDVDLRATALREAHEELGIEGARVVGELSSIPLYTSDYRLMPYVAVIEPQPLVPSAGEIAAVLQVDVATQLERDELDAIPWRHDDYAGLSPAFALGEHVMFGATAHAFYELLCVLAPLLERDVPPLTPGRFSWRDVLGDAAPPEPATQS